MKNKLNRYFLLIVTTLAMLLSSCSDFSDSDSGSTGGKMSAVKIALNADSRTALPSAAEASEFKKFSLTYKKTEVVRNSLNHGLATMIKTRIRK